MHGFRQMALAALALVAYGTGCDTHAIGIEECRAIEAERCRSAQSCDLGITSAATVAECERFARDNCLHGLPTATVPRPTEVDRCVAAIRTAGACAKKHGPKYAAKSCAGAGTPSPSNATVCELVQDPEESSSCAFLLDQATPEPTTSPSDAGAG